MQHRDDRYATFAALQDASYKALFDRTPLLWLGTRGTKLGEDVWLFGTAGGVVAYRAGRWFLPDRLNWMLPDQHLNLYGARTVHAVATDQAGHIYVGTDRGLLIYDSGGGDAAAFLISNHGAPAALGALETGKLKREADILLTALQRQPNSATARTVQQLVALRQEIETLKARLAPGVHTPSAVRAALPPPGAASTTRTVPAPPPSPPAQQTITADLAQKEKAYRARLARLEREDRSLYQMLELKPLDLAALGRTLAPDQAVIQYLPTPQTLYIHLVTRQEAVLREVQVSDTTLYERAREVTQQLAQAARQPRQALDEAALQAALKKLYEWLLRPVEDALTGHKHIFIVPVGVLMQVPFAALVRSTAPRVEYALERFTFGYLPSMYLLDLVLRHLPSSATDALVLGDPDGSLAGARDEARTVHRVLGGAIDVQLGPQASYANLLHYAPSARVVHLATHGQLNPERPEESYLQLADGYQLSVVHVMDLPLQATDLVVLSACETGLGGTQGLEYATLARAFAHAGVPTLVATLWRVDDTASRQLMETFYTHLHAGDDVFTALAQAQRALLRGPARSRAPAAWAGYVPLGKP